jgi:hypothetical protein
VTGLRKGLERLGERFASNATYQFLRNQDADLQIICNE